MHVDISIFRNEDLSNSKSSKRTFLKQAVLISSMSIAIMQFSALNTALASPSGFVVPGGNYTINETNGNACADAGGTPVETNNLFTAIDSGSFGTGSGADDEFLPEDASGNNIYSVNIEGGDYIDTFTGFAFGNYSILSNMIEERNRFQHDGPIYDPVNGEGGRFLVADPDLTTDDSPFVNSTLTGLVEGASYQISYWAANSEPNGVPNNIGVFLADTTAGVPDFTATPDFESGPLPNTGGNAATPAVWRKFSHIYVHNNASSAANIFIGATEILTGGRDIWLDEMVVELCEFPADLSITKTDSQTDFTPGESFSYSITAGNNGPFDADGTIIADTLPAWAISATWTCAASSGAVCPVASGSGDLNEEIATFPNGGQLIYTISGTYSADMTDY